MKKKRTEKKSQKKFAHIKKTVKTYPIIDIFKISLSLKDLENNWQLKILTENSLPFNQDLKSKTKVDSSSHDLSFNSDIKQTLQSNELKNELIESLSSSKLEIKLRNAGTNIGIANDVSNLSRACSIQ